MGLTFCQNIGTFVPYITPSFKALIMRKSMPWIVILLLSACLSGKQQTSSDAKSATKASDARISCTPTPADLNTSPGYDGRLSPLFEGLDIYHYPVTTKSRDAQKFFNQGFVLNYGFNHAEAARSFREAIRQDPDCAMCYWGLAYVLGPNYNAPMEPDILPAALEALQGARLTMHKASPKERALIEALAKRYPADKEIDPKPYYEAYADAMRGVMRSFPDDPDIAMMTAEALMDLHPWDLWHKNGDPQPWTPEIVDIIEGVLKANPTHPQGAHLYIHTMEASKDPERVLSYARMLENRVPGSGHLLHMPSHLYINTGHFHDGAQANERAVKVDSAYVASCHEAGIYPLGYYPHNWHFLAACAALDGQGKRAVEASRYMSDFVVDKELMYVPVMSTLQHFYSIPWFVMVKFARWDDILREPAPDPELKYPTAIWNYAQGMAHAAKGSYNDAADCLKYLRDVQSDSMVQKMTIWDINTVVDIIKIAEQVLQGEMVRRQGHFDIAAQFFGQAVVIEDGLNYNEPPDWFFSVRHHLGDALLSAGKFKEAEEVYRTDLLELKNNGWALMGLYKSLEGQGRTAEAEPVLLQYKEVWKHADVVLMSSVVG
jgi:tetratricopeptide (TPR) repeat protein